METINLSITADGCARLLDVTGAVVVIPADLFFAMQQRRIVLTAEHGKKIADVWYAQTLESYRVNGKAV